MKPLAVFRYYLLNKRKSIAIFCAISLSVFLLYFVQMLIDSALSINYRTFVLPQKYFTSIAARSKVIDARLMGQLKSMEQVEKLIPWISRYTNFDSSIGGRIGTKVITGNQADILLLMKKMGLKLKAGRLPEPGTSEIALHELVAVNKKLKVGDRIGNNLVQDEVIEGEKVISGLIQGESIISFDSLEYWMEKHKNGYKDYSLGIILLPKEGAMSQLERSLNQLDTTGLEVRTYTSVALQDAKETESIHMLLTMINMMVIAIVSICTGFISYIYFAQRQGEFGILAAMGYTRQEIIRKAFFEIFWIDLVSFGVGILLSWAAGLVLNLAVFMPKGQPLVLWEPDYVVKAVCVPVFAILFSVIPVWRMLKRLDPVSTIERVV